MSKLKGVIVRIAGIAVYSRLSLSYSLALGPQRRASHHDKSLDADANLRRSIAICYADNS